MVRRPKITYALHIHIPTLKLHKRILSNNISTNLKHNPILIYYINKYVYRISIFYCVCRLYNTSFILLLPKRRLIFFYITCFLYICICLTTF